MTKTISEQVDDLAVISAMRKLFRSSKRWTQGEFIEYDAFDNAGDPVMSSQRYCILGGMAVAAGYDDESTEREMTDTFKLASETLASVIVKLYKERTIDRMRTNQQRRPYERLSNPIYHESTTDIITVFNDHDDTTIEDIRKVLKLAEKKILNEVEDK